MKTIKTFIFAIAFTIVSLPAFAAENVITVEVNGLVCDFCARATEKVIGKQEGVESVKVDLTTKHVLIHMKEGHTLSDDVLTGLISDSGYSVSKISRGAE
ncbi:MAG: cation transporter [Alphaproteobacteria bacterium]|nr:cation transporter [Alphaproteobacteria bacterium]